MLARRLRSGCKGLGHATVNAMVSRISFVRAGTCPSFSGLLDVLFLSVLGFCPSPSVRTHFPVMSPHLKAESVWMPVGLSLCVTLLPSNQSLNPSCFWTASPGPDSYLRCRVCTPELQLRDSTAVLLTLGLTWATPAFLSSPVPHSKSAHEQFCGGFMLTGGAARQSQVICCRPGALLLWLVFCVTHLFVLSLTESSLVKSPVWLWIHLFSH